MSTTTQPLHGGGIVGHGKFTAPKADQWKKNTSDFSDETGLDIFLFHEGLVSLVSLVQQQPSHVCKAETRCLVRLPQF